MLRSASLPALRSRWSACAEWTQAHALILSLSVLTIITAVAVGQATLIVNGTRYFWLDDDQMISMRYARNVADGLGLVWNAGERVEGYTSLGWLLVMSLVHVLPIPDATTSLVMKSINWGLACWVLVLTDRLLRLFAPDARWERPAALLSLALCYDLLFWSVNGFETTLLTALFMYAALRVVRGDESHASQAATYLLIGLLPIVRSDAYHLWAGLVVLALIVRDRRLSHLTRLSLAVVAPVLHVAFRLWYYGEWLPNTYYLKVAGMSGLVRTGANYLTAFGASYVVAIVLAVAGICWSGDRRRQGLACAALFTVAYVLMVGEDIMVYFRFIAPWVPLLVVLAATTCADIGRTSARGRALLAALLFAGTTSSAGIHGLSGLTPLQSVNGEPENGLVVGLLIRDSTAPDASVAVVAAGNVPYFSRRRAIDLLGKTDARVAHLPAHTGTPVGHAKFDIDGSLSAKPDLVVPMWRVAWGSDVDAALRIGLFEPQDFSLAVLASRAFQQNYRDQPVRLRYLQDQSDVFVRRDSTEFRTIPKWREPRISN